MRRVALLLLVFIGFTACKNNDSGNSDTIATDDSTIVSLDTAVSNSNYYKHYTGTIANVPVVLNLIKSGTQYTGTYYYENIGDILRVYSNGVDSNGMITFLEHAPTDRDDDTGPQWHIAITADTIKGTWISGDRKKTYDVYLKEDYTNAIKLDVMYDYDSIRYIDSLPQPMATCELQFIAPTSNDQQAIYLSKAMGKILVCSTSNQADYEQCMDKKKKEYFATYMADMKDIAAQDLLTESYSYNFSWTENQNVYYNKNGWLCICIMDWQYTGGAHGNYYSAYSCIDMQEERIWELKDIVTNTNQLIPFIDKEVRRQFDLTDEQRLNSRLFVDEMYATNNFFITDKGITFVYTSYEIASYADGEVNVFIPFNKITNLLTPAFKKRMGIITTAKTT